MEPFSPPAHTAAAPMQRWLADLGQDGLTVLAAHQVPVQLWMAGPHGEVLHFLARGTRFTLRRFDSADLTRVILRSECDCEEHRTAGASHRVVLAPHAVPLDKVVLDGALLHGWTGVEAGLAGVPMAASALAELRGRLASQRDGAATAVA